MTVLHSAPRFTQIDGLSATLGTALGDDVLDVLEAHGELVLSVKRDSIAAVLETLRDHHDYQQLMEIAGADYPDREERFEVVYMLLSLTQNSRIMVKVSTDEASTVPTVTHLWPNAGWLEREVFDLYGVVFDGNQDLRRILTDYGFEGHPFRKDFPMTGYTELRYSEEEKRVVYQPVELAQEMRTFDFLSPWEGADYVLPGDEKAMPADGGAPGAPKVDEPKTTESPKQTGAGAKTDAKAAERKSAGAPAEEDSAVPETAPEPTEDEPERRESEGDVADTKGATQPKDDE